MNDYGHVRTFEQALAHLSRTLPECVLTQVQRITLCSRVFVRGKPGWEQPPDVDWSKQPRQGQASEARPAQPAPDCGPSEAPRLRERRWVKELIG
jgi:hypothetical protein